MTIQELKSNREVYHFLKENKIFCKQTEFSSAQCATIRWLYGSHPFYSRQDDTKEELRRWMIGIKDCEVFNVIPGKGTEKEINKETGEERTVVQESLRIEVPVKHVDAVRDHFYRIFSEGNDAEFPVTGHMHFVLKRLSAKISKKINYVIRHINRISGVPV